MGCVYFLKHNGMSSIKIGMSIHDNPSDRFDSFNTYAPMGGELIGYIITDTPNELELYFHHKYKK